MRTVRVLRRAADSLSGFLPEPLFEALDYAIEPSDDALELGRAFLAWRSRHPGENGLDDAAEKWLLSADALGAIG